MSEGAWIVQAGLTEPRRPQAQKAEKSGKGPQAKAFRRLKKLHKGQEMAKSLQKEAALHVP